MRSFFYIITKLRHARCANCCAANIEVRVVVAINTFLVFNAVNCRSVAPTKPTAHHEAVNFVISIESSISRMIIIRAVVQHASAKLLQVLKVLKVDGLYKIGSLAEWITDSTA